MNKNKKIVLILVLAFILAVVGGVAIYFYLTPKKITIYAFKENIPAGTVITEDMLTPIQADATIFYGGSKQDASVYYVTGNNLNEILKSGDSLRQDVVKGMPFTFSLLTANGGSKIEMRMNPTKVAITIPVTNITGVTNELKNGSRVNIYVTGGDSNGLYSTKLVFENMPVLSVGYSSNGMLESATIETSVDESMELVYYASSYQIYLGLVDGGSYQYSNVSNPYFTPETGSITYAPMDNIDEEEINDEITSEQPTEEQPTEEQSTEGQSTEEQSIEEVPTE